MHLQPLKRVDSVEFSRACNRGEAERQAFVVAAAASAWPVMPRLQLDRIAETFGDLRIPVRYSDDEMKFFFRPLPFERADRQMMSLREYLQLIGQHTPASDSRPPYAGNIDILNDPAVSARLAGLARDCRFPTLPIPTADRQYRLWIGASGQRSTIHNDPYYNLNVQIAGRKRFLVFAPDQHVSLHAVFFHPGMWVSPVDASAPDAAQFPEFANVRGWVAELQAGDLLFMPRFWWHSAEALTPCVNLNQWVHPKTDTPWWHSQPEARPFISYNQLLQEQTHRFEALEPALKKHFAPEFERLRAELRTLGANADA